MSYAVCPVSYNIQSFLDDVDNLSFKDNMCNLNFRDSFSSATSEINNSTTNASFHENFASNVGGLQSQGIWKENSFDGREFIPQSASFNAHTPLISQQSFSISFNSSNGYISACPKTYLLPGHWTSCHTDLTAQRPAECTYSSMQCQTDDSGMDAFYKALLSSQWPASVPY
jgi:hypothetical protein